MVMETCKWCGQRYSRADSDYENLCSKKCYTEYRADWYRRHHKRDIDEVSSSEFIDEANRSNEGSTKAGQITGKAASIAVGIAGKAGSALLDKFDQEWEGTGVAVFNKGLRLAGKGIGKLVVKGASKTADVISDGLSDDSEDYEESDNYDDSQAVYSSNPEDAMEENSFLREDLKEAQENAENYKEELEKANTQISELRQKLSAYQKAYEELKAKYKAVTGEDAGEPDLSGVSGAASFMGNLSGMAGSVLGNSSAMFQNAASNITDKAKNATENFIAGTKNFGSNLKGLFKKN